MSAQQAEAANQRMTALAASVGLDYHLDDVRMAIPSMPTGWSIWPPPTAWATP